MNGSRCTTAGLTVPEGRFPAETPLAMAYVPYQQWENTYPENTALEKGTVFPCLDFPFLGKEGVKKYGQ
ncbi:MAG: spore coat associated protein CotJA [Ruminococcus sp.]|nr:spore coat associated protein CotJA [Ruminococcus sp.]